MNSKSSIDIRRISSRIIRNEGTTQERNRYHIEICSTISSFKVAEEERRLAKKKIAFHLRIFTTSLFYRYINLSPTKASAILLAILTVFSPYKRRGKSYNELLIYLKTSRRFRK